MDDIRYSKINFAGCGLSTEEVEKGWHFCVEWDGLLIGPGMVEFEKWCQCDKPEKESPK